MKKKQKWLLIGLSILVFSAIATIVIVRYVPWHKLIKVPTSGEMGFVDTQDPVRFGPHTLTLNFEIDSTQDTPSRLYKGLAHSGNYSARVFGKNVFSVSIHKKAGEIGVENLDGIGMSAWVYAFPTENEVNGSLVFSANNSVGVNICWKGIHFAGPHIPIGKWTKVTGYYDLSDVRFRPDDQIQLYFWNNSSTDLLVDDFCFVFGAPNPRMGDSALVDMTRSSGYTARFNMPPFRTLLLQKEMIGNNDQLSLLPGGDPATGTIDPDDRVLAGHFITAPADRQSMLVVKPDGQPALYHYCQEKQQFMAVRLTYPASLPSLLSKATILAGKFLPSSSADQLVVAREAGSALIGFSKEGTLCSTQPATGCTLSVIWQSSGSIGGDNPTGNSSPLVAGDLDGDRMDEILLFTRNGSWNLLQFVSPDAGWRSMASGDEYPIREWNPDLADFVSWTGPFLPDERQDLLLTILKDKKSGYSAYTMLRYLPGEKKFIRIYPDANQSRGVTIGLDTLRIHDQLWPVSLSANEPATWFRYSRDWRYDLKQIGFNDTTFQILHAIDFTGYSGDQNPKYYEILVLHPGKWIDPAITSWLVIARNCKDPQYRGGPCSGYETNASLPNTLQLYSIKPKTN